EPALPRTPRAPAPFGPSALSAPRARARDGRARYTAPARPSPLSARSVAPMVALLPRRVALGLAGLLVLSASAAFAASAPAPRRVQRESPFMTEFRKLMQVKAIDEMAALIKKNEPAALAAIRETVLLIREGSNETLEVEIDALGRAWKKAYDSDFVILQYDYFALRLTGPYKRQHKELSDRWLAKQKEFDAALAAKEAGKYAQLAAEFE